jgi:hypothetical protein
MNIGGADTVYISGNQTDGANAADQSDWNYQVRVDQGSDGSVENTETMSEAEVNTLLESRGIRFENGVQKSVDGFAVTPGNAMTMNNLSAAPTLPNVTGPVHSSEVLTQRLGGLSEGGATAGAMAWLALSEMARTSMKDLKMAKELRNALQVTKFEEKQLSLDAQETKVEAEKGAAWSNFAWQLAGAVVAIGTGAAGAAGKMPAMLSQGFVQSSQVLPALGSAIDKQWGHQAKADEQDLIAKGHDLEADKMDMYVDEASSNYQEAKQAMDKAIKLLEDHTQRQTDALNNILR